MSNKIYKYIPLIALLGPWIGVHIDQYIPLGYLLFEGVLTGDGNIGFYVLFLLYFLIYSLIAWLILFIINQIFKSQKKHV